MANKLLKEGHSVVVTDASDDLNAIQSKSYTAYKMTASHALYQDMFQAHDFDAVFFISVSEDYFSDNSAIEIAEININLERALDLSYQTNVAHFINISSTQVYGNSLNTLEDMQPEPSSKIGQILLNGENLCRFYANKFNLPISIVRVPYIYGPQEKNSFLYELINKSIVQNNIKINTCEFSQCGFLHIDDFFIFIRSLLETIERPNIQVFNLCVENINYSFLTQQIKLYFSKVEFTFLADPAFRPAKQKIEAKRAKEQYDWNPQHQLIQDLPTLLQIETGKPEKRKILIEKMREFTSSYRILLIWGEVILGAFFMHMLTIWSNTIVEFKYIDYRLLYVVIIGSTHGLLFGLVAALLAWVSGAINWNRIGLDWALLIYNVENWVPFALFFLAGAVTGYVHDKNENDISFEKHQTELIHEKYEFLYSLYDEIGTIKNRLREQLVGYRDSFGRFFRISNELNEYDEDNIFFKALKILEDLMKNDRIAIYSIESTGNYGRLEVNSSDLDQKIPRSLRLSDYSKALGVLKDGAVFQNKDLLPNYPSYIAPISNEGKLIGLVIIWEAKFEQFTMYYFNLFKVITGLIQSSLVRAATFKNMQTEKLFIPSTQIMRPDPFKQSLKIRKKMRRNKIANFQIIRIGKGKNDWKQLYEQLSKGIRSDDIVGILNENDAYCYVLLANAGLENINIISARLHDLGLDCEHIEELESD